MQWRSQAAAEKKPIQRCSCVPSAQRMRDINLEVLVITGMVQEGKEHTGELKNKLL